MRCLNYVILFPLAYLLLSCSEIRPKPTISNGHVGDEPQANVNRDSIPNPVQLSPPLPPPKPYVKEATHTVVVHDVPIRELLFSLARDAKINVDIASDVKGKVTLNAVNQPLNAILERIVERSDVRYELKNDVLSIRKDTPFIKNYRIDYLNMSRSSESAVSVATQISSTGQAAGETKASGGADNNSTTAVTNVSNNAFWDTLEANISAIISGGSKKKSKEKTNNNIFVNRESGLLGVRATLKQHKEIQSFIDEVLFSSRRQVLIEATIAEVKLNDTYQAGINWSAVRDTAIRSLTLGQTVTDISLNDPPNFVMRYSDSDVDGNQLQSTLSALETFGDVKIMSSPKVMVLNNQTALLKVVDNLIYFLVDVNIDRNSETGDLITYETEINSVPIGFVMSVTPYISEHNSVTLNVRPTISRVLEFKRDPNPALAEVDVVSEIPVVQVREVESILKVSSGDTAIIGGLMQDEVNNNARGVPILSKIPFLGALFRYQSDITNKTELVIFIKTKVINDASLASDLDEYRTLMQDWKQ